MFVFRKSNDSFFISCCVLYSYLFSLFFLKWKWDRWNVNSKSFSTLYYCYCEKIVENCRKLSKRRLKLNREMKTLKLSLIKKDLNAVQHWYDCELQIISLLTTIHTMSSFVHTLFLHRTVIWQCKNIKWQWQRAWCCWWLWWSSSFLYFFFQS